MMTKNPRAAHGSKRIDVPVREITVSPAVQRDLRPHRVAELLNSPFDVDLLGTPVLSLRDGKYYTIDGNHRLNAYKEWSPTWAKEKITCEVFEGLTLQDEARMFDRLNNTLAVSALDRFLTRLTAGEPLETEIEAAVRKEGFVIARRAGPGVISAVGTLLRIVKRSNTNILRQAIRIHTAAFGDTGLETYLLDGLARLCQRYHGTLDEKKAVERLSQMRGGAPGLLNQAQVLRKQTGNNVPSCVAAAAVAVINKGLGGKKLPSWWAQL